VVSPGGLELDPGATETHFHLAMAYEAAGRAGDAVEACKRVLALDPTHVAARRLLRHLDSNEVTKQ
jgi:cytochrome c-type biogenesis protein CcmH/NrfG